MRFFRSFRIWSKEVPHVALGRLLFVLAVGLPFAASLHADDDSSKEAKLLAPLTNVLNKLQPSSAHGSSGEKSKEDSDAALRLDHRMRRQRPVKPDGHESTDDSEGPKGGYLGPFGAAQGLISSPPSGSPTGKGAVQSPLGSQPGFPGKEVMGGEGCAPCTTYVPLTENQIRALGGELNRIEREVNEWGHASMTGLVLFPGPVDAANAPNPFEIKPNPERTINDYVRETRQHVAGRAYLSKETSLSLQAGAVQESSPSSGSVNLPNPVGLSLDLSPSKISQGGEALLLIKRRDTAGPLDLEILTSAPAVAAPREASLSFADGEPTVSATIEGKAASDRAVVLTVRATEKHAATSIQLFVDETSTLPGEPPAGGSGPWAPPAPFFKEDPSLSPFDVDLLADTAFVNQKVIEKFVNPTGTSANYQMFFGLAQVSVSPGWRTKKDYFCEVQMRPVFARERSDGQGYETAFDTGQNETPMVFSAFPLLKAQVLDLQYHERRQSEILLSYAGYAMAQGNKSAAKFLLDYQKTLEQDVATRNALPLLVPSSDGTQLTYRFEPGLQAIEKPGFIRSRPAKVLNATSIPTLFVLVCEAEELANWTHVNVIVSTRYVPVNNRHLGLQVLDIPHFTFIKGIERNNKKRLETSMSFDNLAMVIQQLWQAEQPNPSVLASDLYARFLNLRTLTGSVSAYHELPLPQPRIDSVYPNPIYISSGAHISILGSGFRSLQGYGEPLVELVTLDGVALEGLSVSDDGRIIAAQLPGTAPEIWKKDRNPTLTVITRGGTRTVSEDSANPQFSLRLVQKPQTLTIDTVVPIPVPIRAGQVIRLTGSGFSGETQVMLDSLNLSNPTSSPDGQFLTATLPASAPQSLTAGSSSRIVVSGQTGKADFYPLVLQSSSSKYDITGINPARVSVTDLDGAQMVIHGNFEGDPTPTAADKITVIVGGKKIEPGPISCGTSYVAVKLQKGLLPIGIHQVTLISSDGALSALGEFEITEKAESPPDGNGENG